MKAETLGTQRRQDAKNFEKHLTTENTEPMKSKIQAQFNRSYWLLIR